MKDKKPPVNEDTANAEFDRFCDCMDLDVDEQYMDDDDIKGFKKQRRRLIVAIMEGRLVFNETGEAIYTPKNTPDVKPLTFHERTGASLMATNGKKKGHDATRMYAMLGDMCEVHAGTFSKLKGIDIKICEALFGLLMD